ncbi:outer membrane beta-barrel protein [Rhizobium sp. SL86]|uniref:outer membrane beta-barrel protein n=1 Tax=Rhizobium sp. SL86 TaxID=2995148 RepID=UPI002273845A|nr:outer membrane beta-barrel protein [Rhizobium sp. SL86]MCY1666129.1 outer membrane beta-barrel protein [Rhizobium sp. SL86]
MINTISTGRHPARQLGPVALLLASTVLLPQTLPAQTLTSGSASSSAYPASTASTAGASSTSTRTSGSSAYRTTTANTYGSSAPSNATSVYGTDDTDASVSDPYGTTTGTSATTTAGSTALRGTGMLQGTPLNDADSLNADDLTRLTEAPQNEAEAPIDAGEAAMARTDDGLGLRLGSFTLRPSVNQSINTETTRRGGTETRRSYLATTGNWELRSDWARHALTVTGEGTYQRNISGSGATEPQANINADLRLDLADDTIANLTAGYAFEREDANDPNAVANALNQADVDRYTAGAAIERDAGLLRGTAALALTRTTYGDVQLSDGRNLSLADRDRTAYQGRLRLGYELSPALIPFIEATLGRAVYDSDRDASGYARSSYSYGGRGGIQLDLGEKLRGELGLGYAIVDYEDSRLSSIDAFTVDGNLAWSPRRGTTIDSTLRTTVQDATSAGANGWVEYQLTSGLSQQILDDLTGRLTGSTTLRDFPTSTNELNWQVGAGVIWNINRYFDVTANVGYEHTDNASGEDSKVIRAGVGLTLRR